MNIKVSEAFGLYFARLPLTKSPSIINCNALTRSWKDIIDPSEINYILGNPPFGGSKYQTVKQRAEIGKLATGFNRAGILNYVSGWYLAASEFIQNTDIEVGFVSTNSITQGEQVGSLWPILIDERKVKINFGYRTFQWTSEARAALSR